MAVSCTGKSEVSEPTRCNWCGKKTLDLAKIHSKEDKKTLRICSEHYLTLGSHAKDWDAWVDKAFPKWAKFIRSKTILPRRGKRK